MSYVPHNKTDTSIAAAESMEGHASRMEAIVLKIVRDSFEIGRTDEEIELTLSRLGIPWRRASARRRMLVIRGAVYDSGQRRKNHTGRMAIVWFSGKDPSPVIVKHCPTCGHKIK